MPRYFHRRLQDLRRRLAGMGRLAEDQLIRAARALFGADPVAAQHVIALDADVDALETEVDRACVRLLALDRPAAADLRFVAGAMKAVTDLERIGDQAANIARCALGPQLPAQLLRGGLKPMAELAQNMVAESVRALESGDSAAARKVISGDAAVDILEQETVSALLGHASREPRLLRGAFRLAYVARSLERIGDHATNVAEMALFIGEALLERHAPKRAETVTRPAGRSGVMEAR